MSAFMVSRYHIDQMIAAGLGRVHDPERRARTDGLYSFANGNTHRLEWANADEVGRMLWQENYASICARYPDCATGRGLPGPAGLTKEEINAYEWTTPKTRMTPVEILKAVDCYAYQSCEHDEWEQGAAYAFCEALRHAMISLLPGYHEAPWGIDQP